MRLGLNKKELFFLSVVVLLLFAWTMGSMSSAYFFISEEQESTNEDIIIREEDPSLFSLDIEKYKKYLRPGPIHPILRRQFEIQDIQTDEHLFSLNKRNHTISLEQGPISETLRIELEKKGLEIEEEANISRERATWWVVIEGEKRYNLYETAVYIKIYEVNTELSPAAEEEKEEVSNWLVLIDGEREYRIKVDKESYQFSLPRNKYEKYLREGDIPSELTGVLEKGGIQLDGDAVLSKEAGRWEIIEGGEKEYWIETSEGYLDVYKEEIKVYEYKSRFLQNIMRYLFPVFIISVLILGAFISPPENNWSHLGRFSIAAVLIGLVLFGDSISRYGSRIFSILIGLLPNFDLPSIRDISMGNGSESIFSLPGISSTGLIMLVMILVIFLALFFYFRGKEQTGKTLTEEEENISSTAEKAIEQLHKGKNVRDVIIRYYQRMCLILEKEGVQQKGSFTPREFEKKVLEKLSLKEKTIDEMTSLFEKAKYSHHPLDRTHRKKAIENFKQIKKELGGEENEDGGAR